MKSTGFDGFSSYVVAVVVTGVLSPVVDKLISVVHSVSRVSFVSNVSCVVEIKSSAYFMEVVGVAGSFVPFDSVFF